jgi:hypothetical protein
MTDNCGKCKFFKDQSITKKKSGIGWCRRYPDQGEADDWKWCGEFVAKSKKKTKGMVSFNLGAPLKPETEPDEQLKRRWSSGINYADPVHQEEFTAEDRAAFPKINETERIAELKAALNESLTKARNDALKKARNTTGEGE